MKNLQLTLSTASREQLNRCWAFAANAGRAQSRKMRSSSRCVITAVSREAREFGIHAGMAYDDAMLLLPGLRVIIYRTHSTGSTPS